MVRRIPILVAAAVSMVGCLSAAPAQARSAALPQPWVTYSVLLRPPGAASGDRLSGAPGCEQEADALRAACEADLPRPQRPTAFHLVRELPLGPTGKVVRGRLRELAAAHA